MDDPEFSAAIAAAFQAFNERRFEDFATYVTDDIVETYPQSGERIEGRDTQLAFHQAFPNPPTFTVRNVLRSGDLLRPGTERGKLTVYTSANPDSVRALVHRLVGEEVDVLQG